jgi:hypothetical protein
MLRFPIVPLALAVVLACGAPEHEERAAASTTSTTSPPAAAQPTARPARSLSETERASMLRVLAGETGPVRKVWFAVGAGDRESTALKDAFEGVFKQAGWDTATQTVTGIVLKPGLSVLVAAEEPPPYVAVAQQALESTGFTFKSGSGYRAYFEERKRADPAWPGIPLAADQDYVVVVGPQSPPS